MTETARVEGKVLSKELPEVRMQELAEAVSQSLLKGDGGPKLKAIDLDGSTLRMAVEKAVDDALAISPVKELLKAWKGLEQVGALIGDEGPKDDKPRQVSIASHNLKAEFTPHIVIELGKIIELRKLPVPVIFTLKVEGLIVTVTNRRITAIAAGRAKPTVEVKVDGATIFKEALPTINLPLEIKSEAETSETA
ncbi:hypothetical protein [uncultured Roseobacter sp.]|uniref:hypothetical protein n=1 Tax=uncultured Roseobacter sp. TaxID=114847 RepID=UPI0026283084|nr:hypothetical protein [uncultured Roseobacter sp.]